MFDNLKKRITFALYNAISQTPQYREEQTAHADRVSRLARAFGEYQGIVNGRFQNMQDTIGAGEGTQTTVNKSLHARLETQEEALRAQAAGLEELSQLRRGMVVLPQIPQVASIDATLSFLKETGDAKYDGMVRNLLLQAEAAGKSPGRDELNVQGNARRWHHQNTWQRRYLNDGDIQVTAGVWMLKSGEYRLADISENPGTMPKLESAEFLAASRIKELAAGNSPESPDYRQLNTLSTALNAVKDEGAHLLLGLPTQTPGVYPDVTDRVLPALWTKYPAGNKMGERLDTQLNLILGAYAWGEFKRVLDNRVTTSDLTSCALAAEIFNRHVKTNVTEPMLNELSVYVAKYPDIVAYLGPTMEYLQAQSVAK